MQRIKLHDQDWDTKRLENFTNSLNCLKWKFTRHSFDRLFERYQNNLGCILNCIRDAKLNSENIFEYYLNDQGDIEKACYEIALDALEAIHLAITYNKEIVSVWRVFTVKDEHGNKRIILSK